MALPVAVAVTPCTAFRDGLLLVCLGGSWSELDRLVTGEVWAGLRDPWHEDDPEWGAPARPAAIALLAALEPVSGLMSVLGGIPRS